MNRKTLAGLVVAGLLMGGAASSLLAQNGPGRGGNGKGYGGPPQSQEERAARQAACLENNEGVCPNGGPRAVGEGRGMGWGPRNGGGHGYRHGLRDGSGPRGANGTCPLNAPAQSSE